VIVWTAAEPDELHDDHAAHKDEERDEILLMAVDVAEQAERRHEATALPRESSQYAV
jgi:hypothetical protein